MMNFLKVFFPGMMVVGAMGSMVVEVIEHGMTATFLQWLSAAGLYTALMLRNRK